MNQNEMKQMPTEEKNVPAYKRIQCIDRRGRITVPFAWRLETGLMGKNTVTVALEQDAIVIRKAYVTDSTEESFTTFLMPDVLRFIQAADRQELQYLMQAIFDRQGKAQQ